MKLFVFLMAGIFTTQTFAQADIHSTQTIYSKDCTVDVDYVVGSDQLKAFANKVLLKKGYHVVGENEGASFSLTVNGMYICTEGTSLFTDLFYNQNAAAVTLHDRKISESVYTKRHFLKGFVLNVELQKSKLARRMLKGLPNCVIQTPSN